jgi:hypothetical protein
MNVLEHYRAFLTDDPHEHTMFSDTHDLLNQPVMLAQSGQPGFVKFAIQRQTVFAVFEEYVRTVGWVNCDLPLPKLQHP